jgi:putative membrane protein
MFLNRRISLKVIIQFAWKVQLVTFLLSSLVFVLYELLGLKVIGIPFLPVATIGTAVAFYVGFKNNSAYDRLWEARRIWGSITNASRMWAAMVTDIVGSRLDDQTNVKVIKRELLYRHIAWMNLLRHQLRRNPVFSEREYVSSAQLEIIRQIHGEHNFEHHVQETCHRFLSHEEQREVQTKTNMAAYLLKQQDKALIELKNLGYIDGFEHSDMSKLILEFYSQQGASERIKSFPFPRQYANFSVIFVYLFIFLLPFALVNELDKLNGNTGWLVIPFTMLIAWVFNVMEQIGDASENPFDNGINDVPLTAICRNVEIELREMLEEKELPTRIQPVNGIIM